ncbi:hypothetical protein FS837_011963 [Tulasnella sp. UAMH 9824]|nr:hypothetical protein FS837_011963 [Tulasnella sp. UAMH 9824]
MGKPGFLHLPTEILVAIIQILDLRDIVAVLQICRTLYTIIADTRSLQYKLELESNGMVDDQSSPLPIARRVELMRRQNKVWHEWTPATDFKQSNGRLPTYDFQKGILSIGKSTDDSSMTRAIEFHRLRSAALDSPHTLWSCNDLEVDVKDFTTDPDQDLIVLLERPVPL